MSVKPRLHRQSETLAPPSDDVDKDGQFWHSDWLVAASTVEYLPAAQSVQAADPLIALKVPGTHIEQLPDGPLKPTSHRQSPISALPIEEPEFWGQSRHRACDTAANKLRYLPFSQMLQGSEPL